MAQSVGAGGAVTLIGYLTSAGLGLSVGLIAEAIRFAIREILESSFARCMSTMAGAVRMMLGGGVGQGLRQAWLRIMSRQREGIEPS
jgi:hypothetical protein